jgi:ribosome-associated protein
MQKANLLEINDRLRIPLDEFEWMFVRSGGPGGQNVNKVASKAVLRWNLAASLSIPEEVKSRLRAHHRRRMTTAGELLVSSQRYRDQERNRQDCLEKLGEFLKQAALPPKPRRPTKPTRASRQRRLEEKRHRANRKARRRLPED